MGRKYSLKDLSLNSKKCTTNLLKIPEEQIQGTLKLQFMEHSDATQIGYQTSHKSDCFTEEKKVKTTKYKEPWWFAIFL